MAKKTIESPFHNLTTLPFGKAVTKDDIFSYSQLEEVKQILGLATGLWQKFSNRDVMMAF
jgi:hypothetical protein